MGASVEGHAVQHAGHRGDEETEGGITMSISIQSMEHAFAAAASKLVSVAKFVTNEVLPALKKVQGSEQAVEAVTGLVSPSAANVERVAFAVLGAVIKAMEDAGAAVGAGGISVTLDAALVAD